MRNWNERNLISLGVLTSDLWLLGDLAVICLIGVSEALHRTTMAQSLIGPLCLTYVGGDQQIHMYDV